MEHLSWGGDRSPGHVFVRFCGALVESRFRRERTRDRPRPDRRRRSPHVPADHRPPAGLLGGAGLRRRAAVPHRGRRRHLQPRHLPALPRRPSLARGLRGAVHAPHRRALRREPVPPRPLLPVPGGHQAVAGGHPGRVPALARGPGHRPRRARRALRRGQLGGPHAGRLGPGLGGLGRRHGGHPVHVLPAAGRLRPRPHHHRDHLRPRAPGHVPAGRGQRLRPGVVALGGGRCGARVTYGTSTRRTSASSAATASRWRTPRCSTATSASTRPRRCAASRRACPSPPTTTCSSAATPSTCSTRAA